MNQKEIIMKYGIGGMEKIEEKMEEMSFSPNCKNEGLVFGSLRENGKGMIEKKGGNIFWSRWLLRKK